MKEPAKSGTLETRQAIKKKKTARVASVNKNPDRRLVFFTEGALRNSQNFMKNCSGNKLDEEGNRFVGSLSKILCLFQGAWSK
jgi:hypothetical protein